MLRRCCTCKKEKPEESFYFKHKALGVRSGTCKTCQHSYVGDYYLKNRSSYIKRAGIRNREVRRDTCRRAEEYLKTHSCVDCGETDPTVLHFDHVSGIKRACVSSLRTMGFSWNIIAKEIEKCEVRCSNCHMRVTALRRKSKAMKV